MNPIRMTKASTFLASTAIEGVALSGGAQTQHHAGSGPRTAAGKALLEEYHRGGPFPKHPGVAALEAEAATQKQFPFPGMQVIHGPAPDPDIELFTPEDAEQALKIFDASAGIDRHRAILEVMLFSLRIAAINLDVRT